ncbi:hypothetical protein [Nocardiopsis sp. FR6]|uniref:hypothetical protein n=1 Tax=Nocardiopsis sp. FR6 TaxID=2605986 RepID=UPI00135B9F66|nr:hypothetical protein [Nocardiopsis sp. FR6]
MKVLLDENAPKQLLSPLEKLLRSHDVDHTENLGWKEASDTGLYAKASRTGWNVLITNDGKQLLDPQICRAIKQSGLHYVHYELADGLDGAARAYASVLFAIRGVMTALEESDGQRVIRIANLRQRGANFDILRPGIDHISNYWPGRHGYGNHRPSNLPPQQLSKG